MLLKQSTAKNLMVFMTDSSDHINGKTGLTLTITASKDGGAFSSISPTVTERGDGWYSLALTTSHTDTLGDMAFHITGTGADATDISRHVVVQLPGEIMTANVTQIDGNATNGNNAILKLKSLDIRSNDVSVTALDIRGSTNVVGQVGGKAISVIGGTPGTGSTVGGDAIYLLGGDGPITKGAGIKIQTPSGGTGIKIDSSNGGIGIDINSYGQALSMRGGYGCVGLTATEDGYPSLSIRAEGSTAPIVAIYKTSVGYPYIETGLSVGGGIVANITGSIDSISTVRPKKNTGLDNFMFPMFDSTTKNPKTGLTVTAQRAIDGNPFAPCSNSAVELSNGVYRVSLSASDLNGNKVMLRFSATGADDQLVEIITQD